MVKEAAKLAFAMTSSIAFFLGVKLFTNQNAANGTATIAFIMDASPGNNVTLGIKFLLGCLCGFVYGRLCNSAAGDSLTKVFIWIVVIAFVGGFGKPGLRWGEHGFFVMFFALTAITPGTGSTELVSTMQLNVLAITWVVVVSVAVFPSWSQPTLMRTTMRTTMEGIRECYGSIFREYASIAAFSSSSSQVVYLPCQAM